MVNKYVFADLDKPTKIGVKWNEDSRGLIYFRTGSPAFILSKMSLLLWPETFCFSGLSILFEFDITCQRYFSLNPDCNDYQTNH